MIIFWDFSFFVIVILFIRFNSNTVYFPSRLSQGCLSRQILLGVIFTIKALCRLWNNWVLFPVWKTTYFSKTNTHASYWCQSSLLSQKTLVCFFEASIYTHELTDITWKRFSVDRWQVVCVLAFQLTFNRHQCLRVFMLKKNMLPSSRSNYN